MCIYWVISLNLDKKLRQNSTFWRWCRRRCPSRRIWARSTNVVRRLRFGEDSKLEKTGPFVTFRWRHFLTLRAEQRGYSKRGTIYIKLARLLTLILRKRIIDDNSNDSQHITAEQILTTNSNLRITGLTQRSTSKRYSYLRKLNYKYKRKEWV